MIGRFIKRSIIIGIIFGTILLIAFAYAYHKIQIDVDKLVNYSPKVATEILDRNGKRIAYIFKGRYRLYANFEEFPGFLIEALIATEDTAFFEHKGVNPDAIFRAIIKDIKARRFVEGGSTLTQQLVKNKLLSSQKKLDRKIKEAILAIKIENVLSKEEIIERYLNEIFYGNNYYGIKTAAQGYFHKDLKDLTLKEAALLIGIPNAPTYYNPLKHYKRALNRANSILHRMKKLGWITESEYKKATKEVPKVYKTSLTQNVAPYIVDEVIRRFKNKIPDLYSGGYKIYTTIDLNIQNIAKKALKYGYRNAIKRFRRGRGKDRLNGAIVAVESHTGDILAMVGGVSYKESAFNRATMIKRQPGSAFKPFIYQTALDMGYNPASKLTDLARTFKYYSHGKLKIWAPKNYEHDFKGFITLREALVHSRNLATINLVYDIGVQKIRDRLRLLGIKNIPKDMSIALGNLAISPVDMAKIYTVFSNYGHMIAPRLVSKIVSRKNAIVYETNPLEIADFTKPEQAYLMTTILEDVIKRGTGRRARVKGLELAGKTGTTNESIDTWFCGYSPSITTIVWYGRDNNKPIGRKATGGSVAAPAFAKFYTLLLKRYNIPRKFEIPEGVYKGEIDGKEEYYTEESPLPTGEKTDIFDEGFAPIKKDISDDGYSINSPEEYDKDTQESSNKTDSNSNDDIGYKVYDEIKSGTIQNSHINRDIKEDNSINSDSGSLF